MTKLEKLLLAYKKANNARHALYKKRSSNSPYNQTKAQGWSADDEQALLAAREAKKQASKELRDYLAKKGKVVLWGDMNQVVDIVDKAEHKKNLAELKQRRYIYNAVAHAHAICYPLDIVK